jgi:subtilisin-like proprotein convertase family protein
MLSRNAGIGSSHSCRSRKVFIAICVGASFVIVTLLLAAPVASGRVATQGAAPPLTLNWSSSETDLSRSVAWGDFDNDGDLDLAVGNFGQNRVYRNDDGRLTAASVWSSAEVDSTNSIAWGDYDRDGDLDLAVGNDDQPIRLYRNDNGALTPYAVWTAAITDTTWSIAWGDYDGDGYPDLAVGNRHQHNRLYRNISGTVTTSPVWSSTISETTQSVAWGDYDGDGDLDLAVGNGGDNFYDGQANRLYRNDSVSNTTVFTPTWLSNDADNTNSVAWGDYDGDGDIDLAAGNWTQPNKLYRNDNGILTRDAVWLSSEPSFDFPKLTTSIAWGDYDGDGDPDLAAVNHSQPSLLYRNEAYTLTAIAIWSSMEADDNRSAAWGDVDGDGDLDLATGTWDHPNRVYRNELGLLAMNVVWSSAETNSTESVAWGDYDNDGDLDLAVGNGDIVFGGQPNRLYRNDGGILNSNAIWRSAEADLTLSVAWGDYDGDGDLDLAMGNVDQDRAYRNDSAGGTTAFALVWSSDVMDWTEGVAWGDYDGDGDLDLVTGNVGPTRLYSNDSGILATSPIWSSAEWDATSSVAWGDYDNDGDLDLATGNNSGPNRLYRNDNGSLSSHATWSSYESDKTTTIAWGDLDKDGDLDLVVGNDSQPVRLYRNDKGVLTTRAVWSSAHADRTYSVAWGDFDADGDLDLAVGNSVQPNRLYRNDDGALTFTAAWSSNAPRLTRSVAWGDYDGDGDLDLAAGNSANQASQVYRNNRDLPSSPTHYPSVRITRPAPPPNADFYSASNIWSGPTIPITYTLSDPEGDPVRFIRAYYSPNGGGQWLPAVATGGTVMTNLSTPKSITYARNNNTPSSIFSTTITSTLALTPTIRIADVDVRLNITQTWDSDLVITLTAPSGQAALLINRRGGSGDNFTNVVLDDEAPTSIISGTAPFTGRFRPEQELSRFDGATSEGTWVLTIADAVPSADDGQLLSWGITATLNSGAVYTYTWDVFASGFLGQSDNTVFRIEAIPVISQTPNSIPGPYLYGAHASQTFPFRVRGTQVRVLSGTVPVSNALVFRFPVGQTTGAQPYADLLGQPFRTSGQGYLQGRGQLNLGDRLLALLPISATDSYTLYYTSAAPTPTGLNAFTVTQAGVQTLTVSAANPLLVFDLDVSLEWDAGKDPGFLTQLQQNLVKASAALYDWTNGQVALGNVTVYQDRDHWDEADVRLFASNQIRPVANRGGIVAQTTVLSFTHPITFSAGEIRIGPTWNRYGDPQPIGDDWPNVLAHELAHYALFLEDTYLGLDANGVLIPIETCTGTAMSDPYSDGTSEFRHADSEWRTQCGQTLAELPDWNLITLAYPALHSPPPTNVGPTAMPLAFARITVEAAPSHPSPLLDDSNIPLGDAAGELVNGRAYLRHPSESLIDLGRPILNSVLARGAREGDELCIFGESSFTCGLLSNSLTPQFITSTLWQPEILLTPINTATLRMLVNASGSSTLTATLYPSGVAPQTQVLTSGIPQTITLSQPAVEVLIDLVGDGPGKRLITGYAVGSGPGRKHDHGGPGRKHDHGGPFASGDGSVLLYPPVNMPDGVFLVLQTATLLPELPQRLAAIGRAYHVQPSGVVTDLVGASLSFQYLGIDVLLADVSGTPLEKEQSLAVHYWDGTTWTRLDTVLNLTQNFASAALPGPGLYVLAAGRVAPTLSAVSPSSGDSGQLHSLAILGANFLKPVTATLRGQVSATYPLSATLVNSQTVLAMTPITLPADLYDLELVNAGGLTATLRDAFALYATRPNACFFDDFASDWGKWTRTGEWGVVTADGQAAATDSPGASYLNAEPDSTRSTTIASQRFNLPVGSNSILSFRHDYVIAKGPGHQDWGLVEVSFDDGVTWLTLASYTGGGGYPAVLAAADEWSHIDWKTVSIDLAHAGMPVDATTARVRFRLKVDALGSDKGWIIDDVSVTALGCPQPRTYVYLPLITK